MTPFRPTHRLNHNGREILVQVVPGSGVTGPAYTREEWEAATQADWELSLTDAYDDAGAFVGKVVEFLFQGHPASGSLSYETLNG